MRHHLNNAVAVLAVAFALVLLGYTAVAPRSLLASSGEIPTYADAS